MPLDVHVYQDFADLVKAIRRKQRLSQRALAKKLGVSPGYIGQWELRLSKPSADVAQRLCQEFGIEDVEYVQRLAFAQRAPQWLKDTLVRGGRVVSSPAMHMSPLEERILRLVQKLPDDELELLAERVEGWVDAALEIRRRRRRSQRSAEEDSKSSAVPESA